MSKQRHNLLERILGHFNLEKDVEDYNSIHESIEKEVVFKGSNLWILMFAIIVASIGLNMNSTAVIIGAMLISPLMGPINGMGYSIATYNFSLFRKSVKNFTFAVVASLVASTVYFAISPVSSAHSELLARTSPTIYDVLIALFGGFAGIVAITTKLKGNVIPGVAIATALMPPLCTAGYGLATEQFVFFFGAIYLFTINSVFIALASVVVCQALKLPIRTLIDEYQKVKINRWISTIIVITIIPSIYFGYGLVQKERFTERAGNFIRNVSLFEGNYLFKSEINSHDKTITLIYGGSSLTEGMKVRIADKAKDFKLTNAVIDIQEGFSFSDFQMELSENENLKAEINRLNSELKVKSHKTDSINNRRTIGKDILSEVRTIFPQIHGLVYAETFQYTINQSNTPETVDVVIISVKEKPLSQMETDALKDWLKIRLKSDRILIFFD